MLLTPGIFGSGYATSWIQSLMISKWISLGGNLVFFFAKRKKSIKYSGGTADEVRIELSGGAAPNTLVNN
jgi:hypothetical protein